MDYSRKQLPPAPQPIRPPRQSDLQVITGALLLACACVITGLLIGMVALRLMGISTPQSVFLTSQAASLWSDVISLPWKYLLEVLSHLLNYSFVGMFFVIGLVLLKLFSIETGHGWAIFFIVASGSGALTYACGATDTGLIEELGPPLGLLVITFGFEVLWLNPTIVANEPTLQGQVKPNFWVYVFLLEGILFFQKFGSHDSIFNDPWDWWLLAEWFFWLAVVALACLQAWMYSTVAPDLWHSFKHTELYDAIRRFLFWVSRPWIALPVKYPPYKPPDLFGSRGRLDPDQVMNTGMVNDNDPENAPSVEYEERKTTVIDERKTLRLKK